MSKRRGGSLPRQMPRRAPSGLDIRMVIPGLPIAAPDPLAVSLGGSETAGLQLAAELVRQGHRVTIACNTPQSFTWKGVRLAAGLPTPDHLHDLLLVQRRPALLDPAGQARASFLWLHDQVDSEIAHDLMRRHRLAARLVTVSRWQTEQYRTALPGIPGEALSKGPH